MLDATTLCCPCSVDAISPPAMRFSWSIRYKYYPMEPTGARQVRRERCADQVKAGNLDLLLPARKQPCCSSICSATRALYDPCINEAMGACFSILLKTGCVPGGCRSGWFRSISTARGSRRRGPTGARAGRRRRLSIQRAKQPNRVWPKPTHSGPPHWGQKERRETVCNFTYMSV